MQGRGWGVPKKAKPSEKGGAAPQMFFHKILHKIHLFT